ncbi:MAG TPA: hypothetical protein DCZ10_16560 [Pelotomaculum sp.]|nr:hypothetical protein [Pelotomaculum sp.]
MAKQENYLPINAFYITCLRDKRCSGRDYPPTVIYRPSPRDDEVKRVVTKSRMDALDFLIYIALLSRADPTTNSCYPSIEKICDDCMGLDRHTVVQHLEDLEHMQYIKKEKKRGCSTTYIMTDFIEWLKEPHY